MDGNYGWYAQLIKPEWAPPAWLFGPVWTVLYILIGISFGTVFWRAAKGRIPKSVVVPFGLNLGFNLLFTPLQFGLRSNLLAAADILLVLVTLVWMMAAVKPYIKWVAWMQVPYLMWTGFATILQMTVTYLNW